MKLKDSIREQLSHPKRVIVVGNPPYQIGAHQNSRTLYHKFVEASQEFADEILFVIPSRWYTGGKESRVWRESLLKSRQVFQLVDFPDGRRVFSAVDVGAVCFLHWKRDYQGLCYFTDGDGNKEYRDLAEFDVFLPGSRSRNILTKVCQASSGFFSPYPTNIFDLHVDGNIQEKFIQEGPDSQPCFCKNEETTHVPTGHFAPEIIPLVNAFKVVVGSFVPGSDPLPDGRRRVLTSKTRVLRGGWVCTDTYLVIFDTTNEREATNVVNFLNSKFARFMLSLRIAGTNISRNSFKWLPLMDFTQSWDDAKLAVHFGLTPEEVAYIESRIK